MKRKWIPVGMLSVCAIALCAAQVDVFVKQSDGWVVGFVETNKATMTISADIKEVVWAGPSGGSVKLAWDGVRLTSEVAK